jgi:class 3 adenylate cyclase/tetratricopeptide (TPR) repeat protein
MDRRRAIARQALLPDRTAGAALFADVSGFTPLTEALVAELGARRAAEELTRHLNAVYGALIAEVHRFGGSVVSFAGDAITCWFDADNGLLATACALSLQETMQQFAQVPTRQGSIVSLAIKAAVAAGPVRRFLVGDPDVQVLDVLAGETLDRMARAEHHAGKGEVVIGPVVARHLGERLRVSECRDDPESSEAFAVVHGLSPATEVRLPDAIAHEISLDENQTRQWLLPPVYERLVAGQERFLAELRPGLALFLRFGGIEYDRDDRAGAKLDRYVRWVQHVLARHEGYLLQLIVGDKGCYLYAAFGAPLAHGDDAARAVASALELRAPAPELAYIGDVQIGISQGQMRAGAYGGPMRRTYGVLGDEVTAAARLMQKADPGQVLVSSRVADAAGRYYAFEYLGEVQLKGKAVPMPAYIPLGRRAASRQRPATAYDHPLVGREPEMARMGQILELAIGGQGQILRLQGAAGVGKSHLAAEFLDLAVRQGVRVASGACQSTSQGIAYAPWQQAFRALFGLAGSAGQGEDLQTWNARQIAHVEETIRGANPDWLLRLPLLGDLLDLPISDNETTSTFDPQLRQESLLSLAVEVVQDGARRQPVLLLIEDAHWMDEASQALTVALGRAMAGVPALLVVVQRPPLRQEDVLWPELAQLAYAHLIDLDVLSPPGIEALLRDRLGEKPSALFLDLVQAQAHGNPLFTEELVGALRESGQVIPRGDGRWTLSGPMIDALRTANCLTRDVRTGEWTLAEEAHLSAADLGLPDSIHGIVLSRTDRLPERHKLTLKVASVIGRTFELDLLVRAHPLAPEVSTLAAEMGTLERRGMAHLDVSQPQPVYQFRHNITQEVVYQTLLEDQQRELHQAVGQALEELLPDAVERLAYHYSRSDLRDKSLLYLGRAAEKSQREYANETALNYYNEALGLEERWSWRLQQVEVLHVLGRREEEQAGLVVLDAASEAPPSDVAYLWGQYYEAIGDYVQAQSAVERAMVVWQDHSDLVAQARCLAQLGLISRRQGDYEQATRRYGQALNLFTGRETYSDEEANVLVQVLNGLGIVYRQQGDFGQAKVSCERALALSQESGNPMGAGWALNNLGGTAFYQRGFAEAMTYHQQALEARRAIGDRAGEGMSLYNLAVSAVEVGDYGRAEAFFTDALAIQQATGNRWEEVNVWMGLGFLYQQLGSLSRAQDCLEQGLELAQEIGDEGGQILFLGNLGLVMRDQGDLEGAGRSLSKGLALARQQDKYLVPKFLSDLGTVSLMTAEIDLAIERADTALTMRREVDQSVEMTADLATLAAAHLAAGSGDRAVDYARQAIAILDDCAGEGPEYPQRDYFVCYQVLDTAGEADAETVLRSAYRLVLKRADRITDVALRHSFLERVPINRQIIQEAERQGITE